MRRTLVKICGMTSPADVALAVAAGADAIGAIVAAASPRCVDASTLAAIASAVPAGVLRLAVAVDPGAADAERYRSLGYTLQFSGDEPACDCERPGAPYWKVFHLAPEARADDVRAERYAAYANATWMFDTAVAGARGGTGVAFDWRAVAALAALRPIVVCGGLTPENVGACVRAVRPYAVDVRSGVETGGRKDPAKLRAFVRAVREADAA